MKTTEVSFEELYIPHRELQNPSAVCYRVYRDEKNYELLEAVSALAALTQSGIEKPYKIERHNPLGNNIIHLKNANNILIGGGIAAQSINSSAESSIPEIALNTMPNVIPEAVPEIIPEQAIETTVITNPEPIGLSNADVDKLLNG